MRNRVVLPVIRRIYNDRVARIEIIEKGLKKSVNRPVHGILVGVDKLLPVPDRLSDYEAGGENLIVAGIGILIVKVHAPLVEINELRFIRLQQILDNPRAAARSL